MTTPPGDGASGTDTDVDAAAFRIDAIDAVVAAVTRALADMPDDQLAQVNPDDVVAALQHTGHHTRRRPPDIVPRRAAVYRWFDTGDFRRWRTAAGLTQLEVAARVRVGVDRWSLWERGRYKPQNAVIDALWRLGRGWAAEYGETSTE